MLRFFYLPAITAVVCFTLAGWWGHYSPEGTWTALWESLVLCILELSLSFDNAVINAGVLTQMDARWRRLFLTLGMLIAVFGMRLLFPIAVVAVATHQSMLTIFSLALNDPERYSHALTSNYAVIAAFGGMFLLMVFFHFLFDGRRTEYWLGTPERWLANLGQTDTLSTLCALLSLLTLYSAMPAHTPSSFVVAGVGGVLLYLLMRCADLLLPASVVSQDHSQGYRSGFAAFMYLEVLDASFSLDGVIGAFAITRDVVIIMLGLAVGAMCVRSLTLYLVHCKALNVCVFLEHGAHYAIGVLAALMLLSLIYPVPEYLTGLSGVLILTASIVSSLLYKKKTDRS